jgi:hypothetical protein
MGNNGKSGRSSGDAPKARKVFRAGKRAVKHQIQNVQEAREKLNDAVETGALWIGVLGFIGVAAFLVWWGLLTWKPDWAPLTPDQFSLKAVTLSLVGSLLAASCLGWLLVNDGQGAIEKKSGRGLSVILFGVLPMLCLVATLFPAKVSHFMNMPMIEQQPGHPFWLWVRFYPMVLVAVCLMVAFKRTVQPRKYVKKARAAKFLLLSAPYLVVLLVQEITLMKEAALEEAINTPMLQSTLGTAGVNAQLVLAVVTTSRID